MPPRTRAARVNPPAGRVYESPRLPTQQVKFQPRRQKVYGRHSFGDLKRKKQETLTQIGFVNPLTDKEIDEEIEAYEREEQTRNKRRKTLTPSSKFYTQTLTQLEFDSTPKVECRDTEDEDEDWDEDEDEDKEEQKEEEEQERGDMEADERTEHVSESPVPRRRSQRGGIITVRCIKVEPTTSPSPSPQKPPVAPHHEPTSSLDTAIKPSPSQATTSMPPPKTPTRKRTLEVPSSLSPATPLSSQSITHGLRMHDQRSPLKARSANTTLNRHTSPPIPSSQSKLSLPHQSQISTQGITQDSPLSRIPDSSPFRPHPITQSTQSPTAQVLSEFTAASTPTPSPPRRRVAKTEIADSDADSDADLDEEDEDEDDDGLSPPPLRMQPPIQVPSSPDAPRRRWAVTSSSPPRRPGLAVKETGLGEEGDELGSQWTRSQLLPGSLGMDSLLALPPGLGEEDWDE